MWAVERAAGAGPDVLRVGQTRVELADIRAVERQEQIERDVTGLLVMAGLFVLAGTALLFGVLEAGWRTRFLVGAFFLLTLASVSLFETLSIRSVRYVRLKIATVQGDVVFTTADAADADRLERTLAATVSRVRGRGKV